MQLLLFKYSLSRGDEIQFPYRGGLRNTNKFYLYQVIEHLKRQCNYLDSSSLHSGNEVQILYSRTVKAWDDFLSSVLWIKVGFITNEDKYNRFFEGEINKDEYIIPISTEGIIRSVSTKELDAQIEEFEHMGYVVADKEEFKRNIKEVLQHIHNVNFKQIENWQNELTNILNDNMELLCDYRSKLLEFDESI